MCILLQVHLTDCETRRPVVLSENDGTIIYHPFETPPACDHHDPMRADIECKAHGDCCNLQKRILCFDDQVECKGWQISHAVVAPRDGEIFFQDLYFAENVTKRWDFVPNSPDSSHHQLRCLVFNFGALTWRAYHEFKSISYVLNTTKQAGDEAGVRVWKKRLLMKWNQINLAIASKNDWARIWEELAVVNLMEKCPTGGFAMHPWNKVFQRCPTLEIENESERWERLRYHCEIGDELQGGDPTITSLNLSPLTPSSPATAIIELQKLEDLEPYPLFDQVYSNSEMGFQHLCPTSSEGVHHSWGFI